MRVEFLAIEKSTPERALRMYGPIAQLVEQLAFNQWVAGSSPARLKSPIELNDQRRSSLITRLLQRYQAAVYLWNDLATVPGR